MSYENRYNLEDVKDLLRRKGSPFRIYEDRYEDEPPLFLGIKKAVFGDERNGLCALMLVFGEYDKFVEKICVHAAGSDPCTGALRRVFFEDNLEELPAYMGRVSPPHIEPFDTNLGKKCHYHDCNARCIWVAKWRLERGK